MHPIRLTWLVNSFFFAFVLVFISGSAKAAPVKQETDPLIQAETLFAEGISLAEEGQPQTALVKFEAALPFYQASGDLAAEGVCWFKIGALSDQLSQYSDALAGYQASLAIWQALGDPVSEGATLNNIALAYDHLGNFTEALHSYQQALILSQDHVVGDRTAEGVILNGIGVIYDSLGRYQEALAYYQQSLTIRREVEDRYGEANTLNSIGLVYNHLGRYAEALTSYQYGLRIAQAIDYPSVEGALRFNIGGTYDDLGRYAEALESLAKALAIAQKMGEQGSQGAIFNSMGVVYEHLGSYKDALKRFEQALIIHQASGDRTSQGTALSNIGGVYSAEGRYGLALAKFEQALTIRQAIGDQAGESATLNGIANVYHEQGRYTEAQKIYQQALTIQQTIGDRAGEGITLNNIAFFYERQENAEQAIAYYQQAVDVVESIQGDIRGNELKSAFIGGQIDTYEHLVNLLWQENQFEQAFVYEQRAKAKAFLDQIGNQQVDFHRGAASTLIEQEQVLRQRIAGLQLEANDEGAKPIGQQNQTLLNTVDTGLEQARNDYAELIIQLKLTSPEYAALVSVNTLPIDEVQAQVLDDQTTLIEYFVMDEHILTWVIDRNSFEVVDLSITRDELTEQVELLRNVIAERDFDADAAADLYDTLFAPLKPYIHHPNLVIVPHGVLHYLPFAALWDAKSEHYLVEDYALTYAPSASVLNFILEKRNPDRGQLLALGNADGSLPNAENETNAVAQLYAAKPLLRKQATESQVYMQAGKIDILHLAAHGVYDPYNPLYTRIELAADATNDGNLEVHEVFGLDLTNANLVVISACETALGKQSEGDELVGLTRAFLYAGAPSVITTLWSIDDEAAGALMTAFYKNLRSGLTVAEALRRAQIAALARDEKKSPYYWAAFELTGDYRGSHE